MKLNVKLYRCKESQKVRIEKDRKKKTMQKNRKTIGRGRELKRQIKIECQIMKPGENKYTVHYKLCVHCTLVQFIIDWGM